MNYDDPNEMGTTIGALKAFVELMSENYANVRKYPDNEVELRIADRSMERLNEQYQVLVQHGHKALAEHIGNTLKERKS